MKVLIVCSGNSGGIAPFIAEQAEALSQQGVQFDFFPVTRKGWRGYLASRPALMQKIREFQPDIIHAHFGLCGLLANLQRRVPVITTYHGCDINQTTQRLFSLFPLLTSKFNIFVSDKQVEKVMLFKKKYAVIPCGIHVKNFYPIPKDKAREKLGWQMDDKEKIILFSSDFSRSEKNAVLAQDAINLLENYRLIELKGYNRHELLLLMNACDVGLLTSIREGSPMFVKEMMACGRPLVCTDVGDVRQQIGGIDGAVIVDFDVQQVKTALEKMVLFENVNYPLERLKRNDNTNIAHKICEIYTTVIEQCKR